MGTVRKIVHCDCDSFFASIEIRDNPALAGKPVAVGGSPERRGVIATCDYTARRFGIRSAMASATARRRCPDLIIIKPDMEKYREASMRVRAVFRRYTDLIEPLSIDEAFLDVSGCGLHQGSATLIAEAIRAEVRETVGITVSAGVAPNKFLAKVASDWNKPDGQFVVRPDQVDAFVAALPVGRLHGVGRVTARKMESMGIRTCGDLRRLDGEELARHFGVFGERLRRLSLGIDERPVQTRRIRKSVSVENTYAADLSSLEDCLARLPELDRKLGLRLDAIGDDYRVHKQFVKIKFHDFVQTTAEMPSAAADMGNFRKLCEDGFRRGNRPVRLLGLGVRILPAADPVPAGRESGGIQLPLLPE